MNTQVLYPSSGSFLKASELKRAVTLTIRSARIVDIEDQETGESKRRVALRFDSTDRELVLNKSQAEALARHVGTWESDDWLGTKVTLTPLISPNGQPTIVLGQRPDSIEILF